MKSAEELGIEPEGHAQLIAVRDFFLTVAPKTKSPDDKYISRGGEGPAIFNMEVPAAEYTCGTALCVGGYCKLLDLHGKLSSKVMLTDDEAFEIDEFVQFHRDTALRPLFYPHCIADDDWSKLTAKMAAKAIQNFLLTGDPKWHQIAKAGGLKATESTEKRYTDDDEVGSGNFIIYA